MQTRTMRLLCWTTALVLILAATIWTIPYSAAANAVAFTRTSSAAQFYVSKNGDNSSGRAWDSAWNDLDQIDWAAVQPGDTIVIDGGASSMRYEATLRPGKSGTAAAPITIVLSDEPGRDGQAVIFGGRSTPLPYCGQNPYEFQEEGVRNTGIVLEDLAWLVIDGRKWNGIAIHGHNRYAIDLNARSANILVRNVEMYDNGSARRGGREGLDGYVPDSKAVDLSGTNIVFERIVAYDNGTDAFQSGGGLGNFTLRQSWLYNSRVNPQNGETFNRCEHQDGIQIYDGGEQRGVLIEDSIFGPRQLHGLLLGQGDSGKGVGAVVNDVTIRNSLFFDAENANISDHETAPSNWLIEHVTSYREPGAEWHNITLDGTGHTVRNSVFYGGRAIDVPEDTAVANNCQWQTPNGRVIGQEAGMRFQNPQNRDFALEQNSPCAGLGSSIASVEQLLGAVPRIGAPNAPSDPDNQAGTRIYLPIVAASQLEISQPVDRQIWEAESGTISAPFVVEGDYIVYTGESQAVGEQGRAVYRFSVPSAGDYVIKAIVDAADSAANSALANVNAAPVGPQMIWDIPPTSGFEERSLSWRGNGSADQNEFVPKVFRLDAGEHTLIIAGRERGLRIDRFSVELLGGSEQPVQPAPPEPPPVQPVPPEQPPVQPPLPGGPLDQSGLQWQYLEWALPNASYSGNPFDLDARVTFAHQGSGETRSTAMFYDGNDTWKFRFTATRPGTWTFTTSSADPELNARSGTASIAANPQQRGFVSHDGPTWIWTGTNEAFVPQLVMYGSPNVFYSQPAMIDADITLFFDEHGFNGFHVPVYCRWFDLNEANCEAISANDPNPDLRTFVALEDLIARVHARGGVVHLWAWGDAQRGKNPRRWGINGTQDQRLQRYIAARLGPLPGWTMGYGFDLYEWVSSSELDAWHAYMQSQMGWQHLLGARSAKNSLDQLSEVMDYSSYEQHRPDYDTYVETIEQRPNKPSFSEDRFRIRDEGRSKDYTPEDTRLGLWRSTMAGGVANIWGNLIGADGANDSLAASAPYPNREQLRTYARFFDGRFVPGLSRCNELTDGVCLKRTSNTHYIFYRENATSISMNLSGLTAASRAVAVDARLPYVEIDLGILQPTDQIWQAPYASDWAIAVGN